jgi:superfamily II RNA helicase
VKKYSDRLDRQSSPEEIFDAFLAYTKDLGMELYPHQEEAILEVMFGNNVILNTPTGSGKSTVALAVHFRALVLGRRSFYTCPIKALVNEKFVDLCKAFGASSVGLITGDATVNAKANIICCTAEILANLALREGEVADVDDVTMDEFHYYSDRERGVAWQVPLLILKRARFLLMSATLGDTSFFKTKLTELNHLPTTLVSSSDRPVPLFYKYEEYPLELTLERLVAAGTYPIYLVHFSQREVAQTAQALLSSNFSTKEEKKSIAETIGHFVFSTPFGKELNKLLRHGIGIHHAGLLPKYRLLVEKLAQKGLLKIICGTDTLGVGINIPLRTVIFTKLCKFDGQKVGILTARDFHQISGRAGRKGFDNEGSILVMAPLHMIENKKMEEKAAKGGSKGKKLVKNKPPEKGYVAWNEETFEKIIKKEPEPLISSADITQGMLLNVLGRSTGGEEALKHLLRDCHEPAASKRKLAKKGLQMLRSLIEHGILTKVMVAGRQRLRLNAELQEDFSLNQSLSLYLLETLSEIDPYSENYALSLLTLAEAIVENPVPILQKQTDKAKKEKMQELKMQGMEFDDRIAELEKVEYPKPMKDFIYNTFNIFAHKHPWIGEENIRPKSIAREMYETFQNFSDYVQEYELQRVEGPLLRYLSDVYKVLTQTIPQQYMTDELQLIVEYFEDIVRETDASLFEEWERLKNPGEYLAIQLKQETEQQEKIELEKAQQGILFDFKQFMKTAQNDAFRLLSSLSFERFTRAREMLGNKSQWTEELLDQMLDAFYDAHDEIEISQEARNKKYVHLKKNAELNCLEIEQVILDDKKEGNFYLRLEVPLEESREKGQVVMHLKGIFQY